MDCRAVDTPMRANTVPAEVSLATRVICWTRNHEKTGAGDGIRTHDPNLGKVVLYP